MMTRSVVLSVVGFVALALLAEVALAHPTRSADGVQALGQAQMAAIRGAGIDKNCPYSEDCCEDRYGTCNDEEENPFGEGIPCGELGGPGGNYLCLNDFQPPVKKCVRDGDYHVCCVRLDGMWFWDDDLGKYWCFCDAEDARVTGNSDECYLVNY